MTSDFCLDSLGEVVSPLSDFTDLLPFPNNEFDPWMEHGSTLPMGSFGSMQDLTVEENTLWDFPIPFNVKAGFDGFQIAQSLCEVVGYLSYTIGHMTQSLCRI